MQSIPQGLVTIHVNILSIYTLIVYLRGYIVTRPCAIRRTVLVNGLTTIITFLVHRKITQCGKKSIAFQQSISFCDISTFIVNNFRLRGFACVSSESCQRINIIIRISIGRYIWTWSNILLPDLNNEINNSIISWYQCCIHYSKKKR